ncbi:MAG: hypothetical protein E7449_07190 [Ruminococcaceae bacterium]|nr:hypothetical protein [Oscillospiraceae bacterium]
MRMLYDVANLIARTSEENDIGDLIYTESPRQVYVEVSSIGLKRKMEAMAAGLKLEWKFTLSNVAEYGDEEIIEYKGKRYNIVNVYITDMLSVELIAARC